MFQQDIDDIKEKQYHSEYGDPPTNDIKTGVVRRLKRQNTMDDFDNHLCEYVVHQMMQRDLVKIKDSRHLFYKEMTKWINIGDKEMNDQFRSEFCFKSQMVRDIDFPTMMMEVFKPSEISNTVRRLNQFSK